MCNVKVHGFYESKKNFHDRSLEITVTDETGQTVEHVYDLLGGIEKLMDSNHKTTIFHYQTNG